MEFSGGKILIIGLGKTGIAAARLLHGRGAKIVLTDEKPLSALEGALSALGGIRPRMDFRDYEPGNFGDIDLVIPSPGVPPFDPLLADAVKRGVPVLSEIEVASRLLDAPIAAITGTNGKTTTTTLIGEILAHAGFRVFVGGNIGDPLIGCVDGNGRYDYIVAEVSSFQLQWIRNFRPHVAVLLNTTPDHIDYHGTFEAYRSAKEKIFQNQTENDLAILNGDEPHNAVVSGRLRAEAKLFSTRMTPENGICLLDDHLICRAPSGARETYPLGMIRIPGMHNIENVMAAVLAARKCGCPPDRIVEAVSAFKGAPHRIEFVCEKRGVRFYDDSKGTNVGAVIRAVESFCDPIVLMLGGRDKGGDFESLRSLIEERVKKLVIFGEARERINGLVGGIVETEIASGMREGFAAACAGAGTGDIVLLSPGCSSFDEFGGYAERGRLFRKLAKELPDA
jgi:UDP-N-acetylmuramoylalanine--D-glutamate ligase